MKKTLVLLLLMAVVLSGCSGMSKTGAGAALPFAGIADIALLPFTGMGALSKVCIKAGEAHNREVRAEYAGFQTVEDEEFDQLSPTEMAELTSLVYFLPGWCLYPFDVMSPDKPFYCSRHLSAHIEDTHAFTEQPKHRKLPEAKY